MRLAALLVLVGAIVGVIAWAVAGGGQSSADAPQAATAGAQIPTVRQSVSDAETLARAAAAGRQNEDPRRRQLRQSVLSAADRLAASPCEERLRQALREAVAALLADLQQTRDRPVETLEVDGRALDASGVLNRPVTDVISEAETAHVMTPGDSRGFQPRGRLACGNG